MAVGCSCACGARITATGLAGVSGVKDWSGPALIMPPSPTQMGGFNMAKALLLALLCAPAVGVALTDPGDSTPRSLTTNPTVKDDLGGVKDEMRKMREEMTSMQEKVGKMEAMQEKVDGLEKEVGDLKGELAQVKSEKATQSKQCDARIDELEGQLKQINEELKQMNEEKNTQSKQCDARFGSVERNLNETAARVDKLERV
eukprot:SAG31_NODE_15143_length_768_cov_0.974589_1_plen_200_part_01